MLGSKRGGKGKGNSWGSRHGCAEDGSRGRTWPDLIKVDGTVRSSPISPLVLQLPRMQLDCEAIKESMLSCTPGVGKKNVARNLFQVRT